MAVVSSHCARCMKATDGSATVIYSGAQLGSTHCEACLVTVLSHGGQPIHGARAKNSGSTPACMDCGKVSTAYFEFRAVHQSFHYIGCEVCWSNRIESGTRATLTDAPFIPGLSLSPIDYHLLERAARYVQLCLEGGDWDIIDNHRVTSENLLWGIRERLGLPEHHDFTAKTRKDDSF